MWVCVKLFCPNKLKWRRRKVIFYRFRLLAVFFVSLVVLYTNGLSAVTINVPTDHAAIQGVIDAASNGDKVVVVPGTYVENIDFNGKAITLRSSSDNPNVSLTNVLQC